MIRRIPYDTEFSDWRMAIIKEKPPAKRPGVKC